MMYTITLSNGNTLKNLELNGNNFISAEIIEDSVFDGGLDTVIIAEGKNKETHTDMVLVSNRVFDGKSWFILSEKTQEQKERERVASLELENVALHETVAVLEGQLIDTQLALCDVYEQVLAATNV